MTHHSKDGGPGKPPEDLAEAPGCAPCENAHRAYLDPAFVAERAKNFKIDIEGRLRWIDDAFEMIQHAKQSLK